MFQSAYLEGWLIIFIKVLQPELGTSKLFINALEPSVQLTLIFS